MNDEKEMMKLILPNIKNQGEQEFLAAKRDKSKEKSSSQAAAAQIKVNLERE